MHYSQIVATVIAIFAAAVGIGGLLCPRAIQGFMLGYYQRHPTQAKLNPWLEIMKTDVYLWILRAVGILGLIMFAIGAWVVVMGLLHPEMIPTR
jgi:hypothetical protein